jgi:uncharacterized repeat protein (TIGR01451 family)
VRRTGLIIALTLVAASLVPAAAGAQYSVTIVARSCPTYDSITANLARNDIQESLRDLGANTLYRPGAPIDPQVEDQGQPRCEPLPNWRFTFGRDYQSRAVSGPWGSLSRVTGELATDIVTRESTPLINVTGGATGERIAGAVTIHLSNAQFDLASRHDLWLQGGTPADPVLDQVHPGQYGFGALRCAVDNYNGDNVEYVAFPLGARHVFCYAYYVTPPPTGGTIVVRKEVDAPGDAAAHDFQFEGDVSYNPDGFALRAAPGRPASATFNRAGGTAWTVREVPEPGWALISLGCASQTGASTYTTPALSTELTVQLAAGDTMTCTFRNGLQPAPSGLTLGKVTFGRTGVTSFNVGTDVGTLGATFRTTEPGRAEYFSLPPITSSEYRIEETPTDQPGGRWERRRVLCDGRIVEPRGDGRVFVSPSPGTGLVCLWQNEFIPAGSIRVRKVETGATEPVTFTIRPLDADPPVIYEQVADVTREGVPVTAEGDATNRLELGTYDLQETTPGGGGSWRLESVVCNGEPVGSSQGRVRIRLTSAEPDVTCTFSDRFSRAQPSGGGGGGGNGGSDPSPHTNLRITKRVRPTSIASGDPARYTVVLRNAGRVTARDVVVSELQPPSNRIVSVDAPKGVRCRGTRPLRCVVGVLRPDRKLTFRATYTTRLRGRVVNRVAVHTSTAETRLRDNQARAVLQVAPRQPGACAAILFC